jgi:hypothetical protein
VKQLARLVGRQLDERHVVRDSGVVDEHGELFTCTHVGDRLDTGVGAEVGDQWANLHVRELRGELFEPSAATTDDPRS